MSIFKKQEHLLIHVLHAWKSKLKKLNKKCKNIKIYYSFSITMADNYLRLFTEYRKCDNFLAQKLIISVIIKWSLII